MKKKTLTRRILLPCLFAGHFFFPDLVAAQGYGYGGGPPQAPPQPQGPPGQPYGAPPGPGYGTPPGYGYGRMSLVDRLQGMLWQVDQFNRRRRPDEFQAAIAHQLEMIQNRFDDIRQGRMSRQQAFSMVDEGLYNVLQYNYNGNDKAPPWLVYRIDQITSEMRGMIANRRGGWRAPPRGYTVTIPVLPQRSGYDAPPPPYSFPAPAEQVQVPTGTHVPPPPPAQPVYQRPPQPPVHTTPPPAPAYPPGPPVRPAPSLPPPT